MVKNKWTEYTYNNLHINIDQIKPDARTLIWYTLRIFSCGLIKYAWMLESQDKDLELGKKGCQDFVVFVSPPYYIQGQWSCKLC